MNGNKTGKREPTMPLSFLLCTQFHQKMWKAVWNCLSLTLKASWVPLAQTAHCPGMERLHTARNVAEV